MVIVGSLILSSTNMKALMKNGFFKKLDQSQGKGSFKKSSINALTSSGASC